MDTAERQGWIIGNTRSGPPVYAIAAHDDAPGGGGGGGTGGGSGNDSGGGKKDPPPPNDAGDGGDGTKEFRPIASQDDLDRIVQQRLARERAKFADYDDLKTKASELDKLQEGQKTELQKASDRATTSEAKTTEAELRALRLEVAMDKGLTAVQAKRLVGKTKEELEADADELIASFKSDDGGDGGKKKPTGLPKERLRGGGDPTEDVEETDPRKLAAMVDRL